MSDKEPVTRRKTACVKCGGTGMRAGVYGSVADCDKCGGSGIVLASQSQSPPLKKTCPHCGKEL